MTVERQTIDGKDASVSYFTIDDSGLVPADKTTPGVFAKILYDDGEMLVVKMAEDKPAPRLKKQVDEQEAFAKRRAKHTLPRSTMAQSPNDTVEARRSRAGAWMDAIQHIDSTEPEVRDIIERGLQFKAPTYGERMLQVQSVVDQVHAVRLKAFKKAFRHVRAKGV
jgi:hypothetical protein